MTIEREALKLALEVLALVRQHLEHPWGVQMTKQQIVVEVNKVSAAIKQALAPPEQAPTDELHSCPYAEEIHGNYEKVCDCDEERTRQCAQDI